MHRLIKLILPLVLIGSIATLLVQVVVVYRFLQIAGHL
jgi:hypothetical protein